MCHMGREGTQGLLNALLISDISKDLIKNRELGMVKSRDVKTGLSHKCEETDGF